MVSGAKRNPKKSRNWIQWAGFKRDAFRKHLRIPKQKKIPCTFLKVIVGTPIGEIAYNPTTIGVDSIRVTRLVKTRAVNALNLKRIGGGCV
jgi:hypothetical protein